MLTIALITTATILVVVAILEAYQQLRLPAFRRLGDLIELLFLEVLILGLAGFFIFVALTSGN